MSERQERLRGLLPIAKFEGPFESINFDKHCKISQNRNTLNEHLNNGPKPLKFDVIFILKFIFFF